MVQSGMEDDLWGRFHLGCLVHIPKVVQQKLGNVGNNWGAASFLIQGDGQDRDT